MCSFPSAILLTTSVILLFATAVSAQKQELIQIFAKCHKQSDDFDQCMRGAFNELTVYYKSGIPEMGIAAFDPHHIPYVEHMRNILDGLVKYRVSLTDVYEHQWTNSNVTSFRSDAANRQFHYSQDFPDKFLDGRFAVKASVFGSNVQLDGRFHIGLYNYSQTTTVQRVGGTGTDLKVKLHIDKTEKIALTISDTNSRMDNMKFVFAEFHPLLMPDIDEVISVMFTDVFNKSFRNVEVDEFIKD